MPKRSLGANVGRWEDRAPRRRPGAARHPANKHHLRPAAAV